MSPLLFGRNPYPKECRAEVGSLIGELIRIGKTDDFLSEHPGAIFNAQCRHKRAREIGERLNEIGGFGLMEHVYKKVRNKLAIEISSHLEYAWSEIGEWLS
jgi:hypothetical protein